VKRCFCEQINGHNFTHIIEDHTVTATYAALFPNFAELPPADTFPGSVRSDDWDRYGSIGLPNPSGRAMPAEYFMYMETLPIPLPGDTTMQDASRMAFGFR